MAFKFKIYISFLLFLFLFIVPLFSQQLLDEMQIIDISQEPDIRSSIIRDPEQALLIVKSQISLLSIQSNNVIIESEEKDKGTWFIKLVPGTHRVSFQAKGFIAVQQRFYFNPKDVKGVRIRVIPAAERKEEKNTGMIVVQSDPDSADVYFNEQFYGITPYVGKLIGGRYNLKIQKKGFLPAYEEVVIIPAETLPVKMELKRTIGEISGTVVTDRKLQVAVLDFSGGTTVSEEEINTLTDRFRGELVQIGTFAVLSRNNMKSILDEIGFQQSGCTSKECAVEVGKILNVEKMMSGSIGLVGRTYTITISLIDVTSSRIEQSITRDHRGEKDELLTLIGEIANNISNKYIAAKETSSNIWLWIAGGGAVLGGVAAYFILQPGDENGPEAPEKLPGGEGIWPPPQ
jgi:TolB-like protein